MSENQPYDGPESDHSSSTDNRQSDNVGHKQSEVETDWTEPKGAPWYKRRVTLYGAALLVLGIGLTFFFYTLYEARQGDLSAPPGWTVVQESDLRALEPPAYWLGGKPSGMQTDQVLFATPVVGPGGNTAEAEGADDANAGTGTAEAENSEMDASGDNSGGEVGDYALVSYVGKGAGEPVVSVFSSKVAPEQIKAFQDVVASCQKNDCPEGSEVIPTPIGDGIAADRLDISTLTIMREDGTAVVLVVFQRGGVGEYAKQLAPLE